MCWGQREENLMKLMEVTEKEKKSNTPHTHKKKITVDFVRKTVTRFVSWCHKRIDSLSQLIRKSILGRRNPKLFYPSRLMFLQTEKERKEKRKEKKSETYSV